MCVSVSSNPGSRSVHLRRNLVSNLGGILRHLEQRRRRGNGCDGKYGGFMAGVVSTAG
ncbi:hypothetical protein DPMN_152382 [Dreissena polymorpha]|uniref:Uncharacterized protein n=1 Tax=Dreissena polymorpha TaxID=45954 RepID=A0A9D4FJE9_DREPO|nr:hypothetical protein DPMN_152382 [Dreissena polymorpha]